MKLFTDEKGDITRVGIERAGLFFIIVGVSAGVVIAQNAIVGFVLSLGVFVAILAVKEQANN